MANPKKICDVNLNKGSVPTTAVVGNFQPFTKKHIEMIRHAKESTGYHVAIIIVRPHKNCMFSLSQQARQLVPMFNADDGYSVLVVSNGFIGDIVDEMRKYDYELECLCVGTDRVQTFQSQIDRYQHMLDLNTKVIEFERNDDVSSTKVRQALMRDDVETFNRMMCEENKSMFYELCMTTRRYVEGNQEPLSKPT